MSEIASMSSSTISISCPAKINLFLEIVLRRPDGYHEIESVIQAVDLVDTVRARTGEEGVRLTVEGAPHLSSGPGNLAFDAASRFLTSFAPGRGIELELTKRIPDRAGLGGGSSDAAGALLAARDLLRPDLSKTDLLPIAGDLGSDVPFFLGAPTALARGRGEILSPLPSPAPTWLVVYLPAFPLATLEVYRKVRVPVETERRDPRPLLDALSRGRMDAGLFNRLEEAAAVVDPRIAAVRCVLGGRLEPDEILLMTGSGSAFFVVCRSLERAGELASGWNRAGGGRALAVRTRAA